MRTRFSRTFWQTVLIYFLIKKHISMVMNSVQNQNNQWYIYYTEFYIIPAKSTESLT